MHPDNQFKSDLCSSLAFSALAALLFMMFYVGSDFGYTPEDACANRVRESLSPWQVVLLTQGAEVPASYDHVRTWCKSNLDNYETEIKRASKYEQFRSDMY